MGADAIAADAGPVVMMFRGMVLARL